MSGPAVSRLRCSPLPSAPIGALHVRRHAIIHKVHGGDFRMHAEAHHGFIFERRLSDRGGQRVKHGADHSDPCACIRSRPEPFELLSVVSVALNKPPYT